MPESWTILSPVAPALVAERTTAISLGRPIKGVRVGLEVDYAWLCYFTIIDEWETLLRADGAEPRTLWVERSRTEPARDPNEVKAEVEDWAKLVECGVVGLGN